MPLNQYKSDKYVSIRLRSLINEHVSHGNYYTLLLYVVIFEHVF